MELPIEILRSIALREVSAAESTPIFVTVSGAHLYGFASPDSDFDVRGCHLLPLAWIVSLAPRKETVEFSGVEQGHQIDLVTHDAAKYFRLMLKRNGYVMEQVFSPLVVIGGPELEELRDIARECMTRHLYHHYKGFAERQLRQLENEARKKLKTLLYLYRVLLTGIHVLRSGEIEANLTRLLDLYPQGSDVRKLIGAKVEEQATLSDTEAAFHYRHIERLSRELEQAFNRSSLGEHPHAARELDAFLVRLRLQSQQQPPLRERGEIPSPSGRGSG